MNLTIREVREATGGRLLNGSEKGKVTGVSTDSRTVKRGDLFFALQGPKFDGHDYLKEVFRRGAAGAVVSRPVRFGKNIVQVSDPLKALGDLAHHWRKRFPIPVVAVTGSNGKTTTKDLIAAILGTSLRLVKTEGNFNNQIGLPLTLFRLNRKSEAAVLEMGMNHPKEIDRLGEIAEPQVGVITVIARAHLEGVGGIGAIARSKAELLTHLPRNGLAVLNADDASTSILKKYLRSPVVTFGQTPRATVRLLSTKIDGFKGIRFSVSLKGRRHPFQIPLIGRHNVSNALAAIAVADHFGIPIHRIRRALARFSAPSKRMERVSIGSIDLVNDSYNANPDSTCAALESLKEMGKGRRRVAVLGEMLELGRHAGSGHREVGESAARSVQCLFAVGPHAQEMMRGARKGGLSKGAAFSSMEEMIPPLLSELRAGDLVLIKGSRGMKMERVVEVVQTNRRKFH